DPDPPVVTGSDLVCVGSGDPVTLTVSNPQTAVNYYWYRDGMLVGGPANNFMDTLGGNFYVVADNGCRRVTGPVFALPEREVITVISCPLLPNNCVTPGELVTLSASGSFVTGDPAAALTYVWEASSGETGSGETFSYTAHPGTTPPLQSTTITLTVTDVVTGCVVAGTRTITPCGNRY
ncbi:MAG: hypothetical protein AAFN92_10240, partial [Bacteroidota bacterium]